MGRSIRRQLRVMQICFTTTFLLFAALALSGFRQPAKPQNLGGITAERINIVDADGTLRLVISNKDRMHPCVIGGKTLQRPRPYTGIVFFNDQGDEGGGLILTGREQRGQRAADAGLMFDQLGQDQMIGFDYTEENGRRAAAFKVWDRPDTPLGELIEKRIQMLAPSNTLQPTRSTAGSAVREVGQCRSRRGGNR